MKIFANFINSLILVTWLIGISVLAIQNIQAVSLRFLVWQSIEFPIGVLLTICAGIGFIGGSLLPILWQKNY